MFNIDIPIFDGNIYFGKKQGLIFYFNNKNNLLKILNDTNIEKAVVHHIHGIYYDTEIGNQKLIDMIADEKRLIPQFIVNFSVDSLIDFSKNVEKYKIKTLRITPKEHNYPFILWMVKDWLGWMEENSMVLCLPYYQIDSKEIYETLVKFKKLKVVISEVHYSYFSTFIKIVEILPNIYVDISKFYMMDGINFLINKIGYKKILFGSGLPEYSPAPYIFYLYRCGLKKNVIKAISYDNLYELIFRN